MKKRLLLFGALALLGFSGQAQTQTYQDFGLTTTAQQYDTIENMGDTLRFYFDALPLNAVSSATIRVYYQGEFNANDDELIIYNAALTELGRTRPSGHSCGAESVQDFTYDMASFNAEISPSGEFELRLYSTVGDWCNVNRARVELIYDYCPNPPTAFATLGTLPTEICPGDAAITLTASPAGGTFSGTGVTGNQFKPFGLLGDIVITYTASDLAGCQTKDRHTIHVNKIPNVENLQICKGEDAEIAPIGGFAYTFYGDAAQNNELGTGVTYTAQDVITNHVTYYIKGNDAQSTLEIDTITPDNFAIVDHEGITGDDRGGIAITDSTIYVVGDDATVRYDLDLTNPSAALPIRDGIFSDLRSKKLWTLYNTQSGTMPDADNSGSFTADAFRALDANLNVLADELLLSEAIDLSEDNINVGIFVGEGELVLYAADGNFYSVDMDNGVVDNLGDGVNAPEFYGSENWADWGVATFDGTTHYVYYTTYDNDMVMVRHNLTTGVVTHVTAFNDMDISDMCSFTLDTENDRWYFHYEGNGFAGGDEETLGYAEALSETTVVSSGAAGCAAEMEVFFSEIGFADTTVVCSNDLPMLIEGGFGYASYTWNGENNNYNIFPVLEEGTVILTVTDNINCTITESTYADIRFCEDLGTEELSPDAFSVYPNPNAGEFSVFVAGNEKSEIALFDMSGKQVMASQAIEAGMAVPVSVSQLETGIYIIRVTTGAKIANQRLVISK